jgi:hypothetical protein
MGEAERLAKLEKIRESAQEYEGMLMNEMIKSMRQTPMAKTAGSETYSEIAEKPFTAALTAAGGLGLADKIVEDVARQEGLSATLEEHPEIMGPNWNPRISPSKMYKAVNADSLSKGGSGMAPGLPGEGEGTAAGASTGPARLSMPDSGRQPAPPDAAAAATAAGASAGLEHRPLDRGSYTPSSETMSRLEGLRSRLLQEESGTFPLDVAYGGGYTGSQASGAPAPAGAAAPTDAPAPPEGKALEASSPLEAAASPEDKALEAASPLEAAAPTGPRAFGAPAAPAAPPLLAVKASSGATGSLEPKGPDGDDDGLEYLGPDSRPRFMGGGPEADPFEEAFQDSAYDIGLGKGTRDDFFPDDAGTGMDEAASTASTASTAPGASAASTAPGASAASTAPPDQAPGA